MNSSPAHQNSFAFHHNKNSKKTKRIYAIPNRNVSLCDKCQLIIDWRKKYRKYKPLKEAHKCNSCHERTLTLAYHSICQRCASAKGICAKCLFIINDTNDKDDSNEKKE